MLQLSDAIRQHCSLLDPSLVERHLHRMPVSYFERYAVTEVARHLRLFGDVSPAEPVAIEVRSLGAQVYEIVVACIDYPGTIACITSALATDQYDLEDVQISSYN